MERRSVVSRRPIFGQNETVSHDREYGFQNNQFGGQQEAHLWTKRDCFPRSRIRLPKQPKKLHRPNDHGFPEPSWKQVDHMKKLFFRLVRTNDGVYIQGEYAALKSRFFLCLPGTMKLSTGT